VDVAKQLYLEPDLSKQLGTMECLQCRASLASNWTYYPDHYIGKNGELESYERSLAIPAAEDSIIESFPEIYS